MRRCSRDSTFYISAGNWEDILDAARTANVRSFGFTQTPMSPILSYHNEERPPPFKQTASAPYQKPSPENQDQNAFLPSYADGSSPSSPPTPKQHHKPRNRDPDERYGELEAEREDDEAGLLYEMDVIGGGRRNSSSSGFMRRPAETKEERRMRGEEVISGGGKGWFGAEIPSQASRREIREMVYEVRSSV